MNIIVCLLFRFIFLPLEAKNEEIFTIGPYLKWEGSDKSDEFILLNNSYLTTIGQKNEKTRHLASEFRTSKKDVNDPRRALYIRYNYNTNYYEVSGGKNGKRLKWVKKSELPMRAPASFGRLLSKLPPLTECDPTPLIVNISEASPEGAKLLIKKTLLTTVQNKRITYGPGETFCRGDSIILRLEKIKCESQEKIFEIPNDGDAVFKEKLALSCGHGKQLKRNGQDSKPGAN